MRVRTVLLARLQVVIRAALDGAGLEEVPVYALAAPEDVWAIPARPAVACGVYRVGATGPLPMGGGNSGQPVKGTVGVAYLNDDPDGPTSAITTASHGVEALSDVVEPTLRSEDIADGSTLQGPIRLEFVESITARSPFAHDQRAGGLLALLSTWDTTDFYE